MFGFTRTRGPRQQAGQGRFGQGLEALETRQLLAATVRSLLHPGLIIDRPRNTSTPALFRNTPIGNGLHELAALDNDGKYLTGKDRAGNEWQITVHGPGVVVVTDATPNDGALDDDIDTIQLFGTDPNKTVVTGIVTASARVLTDGTVTFNHLIALEGVKTINLDGFTLARTLNFFNPEVPEIYLPGGVGSLSFHDILADIDTAFAVSPFVIQIGDAARPLTQQPTIRIDSIFNTVFDSTLDANPPGNPQTEPTVRILVNGEIHGLEIVSATQTPIEPAGIQYQFPQTTTTGRTAVQALGANKVKIIGSARNTTFSKDRVPFQNGLTGMRRLNSIQVGGVTDGLGLDVSNGRIGKLELLRGLGDPTGSSFAATDEGTPVAAYGYPAFGDLGGLVVAQEIGEIHIGPAALIRQGVQDPDFAQTITNTTRYYTRAGRALTNAAIVTDGSIGQVTVVGDLQSTEIKTGANYASFIGGLEPVRNATSRIGRARVRGNLIDSVISASYRPGADDTYGTDDDVVGDGSIRGNLEQGALYTAGVPTALNNFGAGFFARRKEGYLPPPERPKRDHARNLGL